VGAVVDDGTAQAEAARSAAATAATRRQIPSEGAVADVCGGLEVVDGAAGAGDPGTTNGRIIQEIAVIHCERGTDFVADGAALAVAADETTGGTALSAVVREGRVTASGRTVVPEAAPQPTGGAVCQVAAQRAQVDGEGRAGPGEAIEAATEDAAAKGVA